MRPRYNIQLGIVIWTADCGLRTADCGLGIKYGLKYGLGMKRRLENKDWTFLV